MDSVTRSEIVAGLQALGVRRGSILLVHSALSSLGWVEGGADEVIDALLDVLGAEGTLLMPTHPARDGRVFDPDSIPSDMGRISETFRRRQASSAPATLTIRWQPWDRGPARC